MSKTQSDYDDDDFLDTELDDVYDLDFNDTKALKKQNKAESRRDARNRVEDYFERKALKEQADEWDLDFDY